MSPTHLLLNVYVLVVSEATFMTVRPVVRRTHYFPSEAVASPRWCSLGRPTVKLLSSKSWHLTSILSGKNINIFFKIMSGVNWSLFNGR